ncbi:Swt1 family HEPN domain-containing protein [Anabaena sp. WFMT]|uniref:Swt1 family HEPN domain-containing protein n=1 Tax=Anabaena sp. WFMT TaxID=3449730 RepID=UPI003F1E8729
MPLKFELLCINQDQQKKVKYTKPKYLLWDLLITENLWKSEPVICEDSLELSDNAQNIKLSIQPFDMSKMVTGDRSSSAYYIIVEGDFDHLEPFRIKLIDELKNSGFNYRQILIDDVSNQIAINIYPLINKIETLLRKYIVKFFITKIGTDWWPIVVSKDNIEKAKTKRTNETVFTSTSKIIANVTLLQFDQLGKIIYSQSSIFTKIEDVISKIKSAVDLESLKQEVVEGNYAKYFKDTFEQNDFQKKWEKLTFIRNKVAHNNYFVKEDSHLAKELCDELMTIINNAESTIDALTLSIADKEALIKARNEIEQEEQEEEQSEQQEVRISEDVEEGDEKLIIPQNIVKKKTYSALSEDQLINEIKECSKLPKYSEFIGLKSFINYLEQKGYSFKSSQALINLLADKGKIEFYPVPNPFSENNTTAIRLIE